MPEVTRSVSDKELPDYTSAVMKTGAESVRETKKHLEKPGAINRDLLEMALKGSKLPEHFSKSPHQFDEDMKDAAFNAMPHIYHALDFLQSAQGHHDRAKSAGSLLPLFFFTADKTKIEKKVARQMGLDAMTEENLQRLGIGKKIETAEELTARSIHEKVPTTFSIRIVLKAGQKALGSQRRSALSLKTLRTSSSSNGRLSSTRQKRFLRKIQNGARAGNKRRQ